MLRHTGNILPTIEDSPSCSQSFSSETSYEDETVDAVDERLAGKENKIICWLRGFVIAIIALAAVLVSVVVYVLTTQSETNNFEREFEAGVNEAMDQFQDKVELKLGALESLSVGITSYAKDRQSIWPTVTVPDFASRASTAKHIGDALSVGLMPLVTSDNRRDWEKYAQVNSEWIIEGLNYEEEMSKTKEETGSARRRQRQRQRRRQLKNHNNKNFRSILQQQQQQEYEENMPDYSTGYAGNIFKTVEVQAENGTTILVPQIEDSLGPYLPIWQNSDVVTELINYNMLSNGQLIDSLQATMDSEEAVLNLFTDFTNDIPLESIITNKKEGNLNDPISIIDFPVFDKFDKNRTLVAILYMACYWSAYFENPLLHDHGTMIIVIENDCQQNHTYQLKDGNANYLGVGELYDDFFDDFHFEYPLQIEREGIQLNSNFCQYSIRIYPTLEMRSLYITSRPGIYTFSVVIIFILALIIFITYDCVVERRQRLVYKTAVENRAIVSSLFPSAIRERLFNSDWDDEKKKLDELGLAGATPLGAPNLPKQMEVDKKATNNGDGKNKNQSEAARLQQFLEEGPDAGGNQDPIADLFPHTTVLFGDIAGFTAWSSQREPTQVFTLLQTLYQAFDKIAKKLAVFKIETIGDCYVAVTGLPEAQPDHAVRMARFAREAVYKMQDLVKQLEMTLGPETGDLSLRVGLHSGPVTAGVLRGEKSRFQLFGDTVNTAARMESTGKRDQIQCSAPTAELIRDGGKSNWLREREDVVVAKGKGEMQTFWILPRQVNIGGSDHVRFGENGSHNGRKLLEQGGESVMSLGTLDSDLSAVKVWSGRMIADSQVSCPTEKKQRLVEWHVDLLGRLIKRILAVRNLTASEEAPAKPPKWEGGAGLVADEVVDHISFPDIDPYIASRNVDPESIELGSEVSSQLRDFVTRIASMYNDNAFHNFEHASHVTMAINKVFNRIVSPMLRSASDLNDNSTKLDFTSRISFDPLIHFAVVFSGVIHDVDHPGVGNFDLIREKSEIAIAYDNRSPAEQNSIDVAWELLMDSAYKELQQCICRDQAELERFRQIVVNMVMATDIFDKDAKAVRQNRWVRAFGSANVNDDDETIQNLQATIMLEHTIQAADVGHTMQHWHVYRKWNESLFNEMMWAYHSGRTMKEPSDGWYKGEINFFDLYIIPLAKKLLESDAFGTAGNEYLNYAMENRAEWATKGERIVKEMKSTFQNSHTDLTETAPNSDEQDSMENSIND